MKYEIYRDISAEDLADILQRQDPDDRAELITDRRKLDLQPGVNTFTHGTLQLRTWTGRNSFANDDETFLIAVTHKAQTWARNDPAYDSQAYALAATLEDRELETANLHETLRQRLSIPNRVRLRT